MMHKWIEAVIEGLMGSKSDRISGADMIKAPDPVQVDRPTVFLAGTIDMGHSDDWQQKVFEQCQDLDVTFLNPRRDEWDSSWEQDISNPQFTEQVTWEMDNQDDADIVLMYFAPGSKSPITFLEFGYGLVEYPDKLIVISSKGFWRHGNIQIMCARHDVLLVETLEEGIEKLKEMLN